jgi:uncharacterized protein YoaH (UPF0181 family)
MQLQKVITQLGLAWDDEKSEDGNPTAFEVIQHFLSSGLVSEDAIRVAIKELRDNFQPKHDSAEVSSSSPNNSSNAEPEQVIGSQNELPKAATVRARHIALRFYYDGANYTGLVS